MWRVARHGFAQPHRFQESPKWNLSIRLVSDEEVKEKMQQVLQVAVLAMLGSRNPVADLARLRRQPSARRARSATPRRPLPAVAVMTPAAPTAVLPTTPRAVATSSAGLGRNFEDRVVNEMLPILAKKLKVTPVARLYRLTRHVAHSGDFAVHFNNTVGLVELKNHARSLPLVDRRRFFDCLLINYKSIDWAMLVTSRCSVPHFGEKGYVVVGRFVVDIQGSSKSIPVAFVCGLDVIGLPALEKAIRTLAQGTTTAASSPVWTASELLASGEATRLLESQWGSVTTASVFAHPPGAVF